jgi:death on curing protein
MPRKSQKRQLSRLQVRQQNTIQRSKNLPPSKKVFRLSAAYIEAIHDFGIELAWPGQEPVEKFTCRDLNLLASAATQPYTGGFGIEEYYPTLAAKAAYLFFHIATSHVFENGNKRTAVIALDQFLLANSVYLLLDNVQMQKLAENTAGYRADGESQDSVMTRLVETIEKTSLQFSSIRKANESRYRALLKFRGLIRKDSRNLEGATPRQATFQGITISHALE